MPNETVPPAGEAMPCIRPGHQHRTSAMYATASPAIYRFRRQELERRIEEFITLLDLIDGDPDLEDDEIEDIRVYAPASQLLAEEARK